MPIEKMTLKCPDFPNFWLIEALKILQKILKAYFVIVFAATYALTQRVKGTSVIAKSWSVLRATFNELVRRASYFCSAALMIRRRKALSTYFRLLQVWFRSEFPFLRYLESSYTHSTRSAVPCTWMGACIAMRKYTIMGQLVLGWPN